MSDDLNLATLAIHADDKLSDVPDVAPPIRVSSTYEYHEDLVDDGRPVYSRLGQNNVSRVEEVLSKLLGGKAVAYANGLAAFYAAITALNPKRVFVTGGYHGVHGILNILKRNYNIEVLELDRAPLEAGAGDVVHVETALNPLGVLRDLSLYKDAQKRGAKFTVDATFMPPPLLDPFDFDVDVVLHSGTKYFGGHSDALAGVLATRDEKLHAQLLEDRVYLGTILPSLDSWLILRSLRTFTIRVKTQAANAQKVVEFLAEAQKKYPVLKTVHHASLQKEAFIAEQLKHGGPMCFSIELKDAESARSFPGKLKLFHHCTSLGGVESSLEWRKLSDKGAPDGLLRLSIGVEDPDDIISDLKQAFESY